MIKDAGGKFDDYSISPKIRQILLHWGIVTRNNIVWKLACGYCLCYCKTFSLVPDSTECTKIFATKKCSTLFVPPKIK